MRKWRVRQCGIPALRSDSAEGFGGSGTVFSAGSHHNILQMAQAQEMAFVLALPCFVAVTRVEIAVCTAADPLHVASGSASSAQSAAALKKRGKGQLLPDGGSVQLGQRADAPLQHVGALRVAPHAKEGMYMLELDLSQAARPASPKTRLGPCSAHS